MKKPEPSSFERLRAARARSGPAAVLLTGIALLTAGACRPAGSADSDPGYYRPVVGEQALMLTMVDPAADTVWDAVQTIMTEDGVEEIQPQTDEEWALVRNAAVTVAESGNLLMMGRRMRDEGDWIAWSRDLVDAGEQAMRATEARDPQALFDAGGEIYRACSGCHAQYVLEPPPQDTAPATTSQ